MKLKIVYGKKVEQTYKLREFGFRGLPVYRWEETFSIEKDGNVNEIIFSLNESGEDEIGGKILEIFDGRGNRLFSHETFNNYSTHGLEDVFEHDGCDIIPEIWENEIPFPLNLIHDI